MADYNGNFHSGAFSPEYNVEKIDVTALKADAATVTTGTVTTLTSTTGTITNLTSTNIDVTNITGVVKTHVVTADDVTATKVSLGAKGNVLAIIFRGGDALATNYTLEVGETDMFIKGNTNYTLTADDVIMYATL